MSTAGPHLSRRAAPGRRRRFAFAFAFGLALASSAARAQDEGGDGSGVIYRQRTVYSFEGDTIDGDLMRPDGAYIEARKEIQHSNLIQVRDSFREKVLESVVHL